MVASAIEFYPISANEAASGMSDKSFTELNASLNFRLRGMGSDESDYSSKRFNVPGNFIYLRGYAARTPDLMGACRC